MKLNAEAAGRYKKYILATKDSSGSKRATMLLGLAMALSGTVGIFAVSTGQPTPNIVFFRCLFGAASLVLWSLWSGSLNSLKVPGLKTVFLTTISGFFLVLNWAALFQAFNYISIGLSLIIYHLQPFWIVLIGVVFLDEKITLDKFFWLSLAFVGLVFVVWPNVEGLSLESAWVFGFMFAMLASLLYAGATLTARQVKAMDPVVLAIIHCVIGMLLFGPFVSTAMIINISNAGLICLISLGVVHTGFIYVLLYSNYSKVPTTTIGIFAFLNPTTALVVDYFFYGSVINVFQSFGIISILAGGLGITMNWSYRRKSRTPV